MRANQTVQAGRRINYWRLPWTGTWAPRTPGSPSRTKRA